MFFRDKMINLKYSRTALLLEIFSWLLVVGVLVYAAHLYSSLNDTVAFVFGSHGEVLEYRPRQVVLMQPIGAVFVYVILTATGLVFRRAVVPGEEYPVLERLLLAMLAAKCLFLIYKLGKCFFVLHELPTPLWLPLTLGLAALALFIATIFSCIKQKSRI